MFCERCGTRYASEDTARMAAPLARRLLEAVGVVETSPRHAGKDPFLRFCLACRGYSCPSCWNEDAGFCQTCVPMPEAMVAQVAAAEIAIEIGQRPVLTLAEAEVPQVFEAIAEVEAVAAEPEPVAVQADAVPHVEAVAEVEAVAAEPEPVAVQAEAIAEPPLPVFNLDEATFAELEPEVQWDWTFEPVSDFEPEPAVAAADEPAQPAAPVVPVLAEPVVPALFEPVPLRPAPVFRPLEPMGPILPPPPPPAPAQMPRMEFDLPSAPPAFLIARQPQINAVRPVLPVGLFEGPSPSIRPCSSCELPVSARARFCRRCGSAQG